ncbi:MAG: lysophospholipid acyltransferase family protein [Salibacteraceae bacterium]
MKFLSALLYWLVVIPFSSLPIQLLYVISDFAYYVLYRIIGYRKTVVRENLKNSFPEKDYTQRKAIEIGFYRQFCDNIIEGIKGLTISKKEIAKRMVCKNPELLDKYYNQGKSVIITTGHYYSWELWFLAIDLPVKHKIALIYKPLSNEYFEKKLKAIRASFGSIPIPFEEVRDFFKNKENGTYGYIFGSDQAPHNANRAYWMKFLNQETPVAFGAEKFGTDNDIPVVFCKISRVKRGYYEFEYVEISAEPTKTEYGEITKGFTRELESTIKHDPVGWLWSHKRWKREKPEGMKVHGA